MIKIDIYAEDKTCPFCQDIGFDLPGLKAHLTFYCEAYHKTESLRPHYIK